MLPRVLRLWPDIRRHWRILAGLSLCGVVLFQSLVYLGLRMLLGARHAVAGAATESVRPLPRPFLQGFVTHLANPKAVLYWSALLPQFLALGVPLAPQVLLFGSLGIVLDVIVLSSYGLFAAAARRGAVPGGLQRAVNIAGGAFFVCAGVLLALAQYRA